MIPFHSLLHVSALLPTPPRTQTPYLLAKCFEPFRQTNITCSLIGIIHGLKCCMNNLVPQLSILL